MTAEAMGSCRHDDCGAFLQTHGEPARPADLLHGWLAPDDTPDTHINAFTVWSADPDVEWCGCHMFDMHQN